MTAGDRHRKDQIAIAHRRGFGNHPSDEIVDLRAWPMAADRVGDERVAGRTRPCETELRPRIRAHKLRELPAEGREALPVSPREEQMRYESEGMTAQMRTATCCELRQPAAHPHELAQVTGEVARDAAPPRHFDLVHPRALRDELIDATVCVTSGGDLTRPHPDNREPLERVRVNTRVFRAANDLEGVVHGRFVAEQMAVLHQEACERNGVPGIARSCQPFFQEVTDRAETGTGPAAAVLNRRAFERGRVE